MTINVIFRHVLCKLEKKTFMWWYNVCVTVMLGHGILLSEMLSYIYGFIAFICLRLHCIYAFMVPLPLYIYGPIAFVHLWSHCLCTFMVPLPLYKCSHCLYTCIPIVSTYALPLPLQMCSHCLYTCDPIAFIHLWLHAFMSCSQCLNNT